ncbi:ABC transporter ATP-binding protein [Tundrisphaera lichenicola]|uniref:ABC transporter ATP-binding protein n=1 Tax=Tundrisphaera lichenicola TaxID=2029860 RepID=UPI003EB6F2CE
MTDDSAWPRGQPFRLHDVRVARGTSEILRGVDLTFEPGYRYVLIGASGAGKSTLLRLLNRLDDPDSGTLSIGDIPLRGLTIRVVRSAVGLVFQAPRPLPGRLLDNLAYPFEVRGLAVPEPDRLAGMLDEVGLDPIWLDRDASALSGGERQRLAIAASLAIGPEFLVMDEPTSALDPASAHRVAAMLERRAASGLRTIVVTHNREQAARLGDRTIRLEAGRVVDQGPTSDVLARADASIWNGSGEERGSLEDVRTRS